MLQLSQSQTMALDAFNEFLNSNNQVFMLKGAAGTGKTTLVSEFLKLLKMAKRPVGIMAPTGRAAYIIGQKTEMESSTIHRYIYTLSYLESTSQNKDTEDDGGLWARYRVKVNEDPGSTVYIVDEASMISDAYSENEAFLFGSGKLLTDLLFFARGRKFVFVGDYAQLPPVGMNFSPALDKDYIENKFDCNVIECILSEVMRQSNKSTILANATKIRENIEAKNFVEFKLEEGEDSIRECADLLNPYFNLSQNRPSPKSAIITHSNQQALQYNLTIRKHYYGEYASRLENGELLMICRNNYAYGEELFNGNIVKVESCTSDVEIETKRVNVKLGKDRIETVELRFRKVTILFMSKTEPVELNVRLLDNFLDNPSGSLEGLLARGLIVDFNNRLPQKIKEQLPEIKRLLRANANLTIEQQELHAAYLNLLHKDPYYNAVLCKYGYAMTCHKAQGGEWDNVFVDMGRFGGVANEDYFRWAYTALTRASKKLWHFRSPEFNYISKLVVEPIQYSKDIKISVYSSDSDFCQTRFNRIKNLCDNLGISVKEGRTISFQHRLTFHDKDGENVTYSLWYNAKGYSGKDVLYASSSDEFTGICRSIIESSFLPDDVPFVAHHRPFAEKFVTFVKSQIHELDIVLLNITQEAYHDVFHLKTDGFAKIEMFYTNKGNYTYMRLQSSLGSDDVKLEALRQRFI